MANANVLVSGKLGDLFHSLWVCHHLYHKHGLESNVYMSDHVEKFENGLVPTFNELHDIIISQVWCSDFTIWGGENIEIDTTQFRKSQLLYRACWTEIMCQTFFTGDSPILGSWINVEAETKDRLVINRRYKNEASTNIISFYEQHIDSATETIFLGSERDYELFPLRDKCTLVIPENIHQWLTTIASSTLFIGNQSSPLAMASALDVRRIAELLPPNYPDGSHYKSEGKYYQNFLNYII